MYRRKKFSLFDTGAEGDPKRVFLDFLFVLTGPLVIVPYSMVLGVIWTVLAAAFLVMDVVQFVRKKQSKKAETAAGKKLPAAQEDAQEEKKD